MVRTLKALAPLAPVAEAAGDRGSCPADQARPLSALRPLGEEQAKAVTEVPRVSDSGPAAAASLGSPRVPQAIGNTAWPGSHTLVPQDVSAAVVPPEPAETDALEVGERRGQRRPLFPAPPPPRGSRTCRPPVMPGFGGWPRAAVERRTRHERPQNRLTDGVTLFI